MVFVDCCVLIGQLTWDVIGNAIIVILTKLSKCLSVSSHPSLDPHTSASLGRNATAFQAEIYASWPVLIKSNLLVDHRNMYLL
jgi:hypothetical protein